MFYLERSIQKNKDWNLPLVAPNLDPLLDLERSIQKNKDWNEAARNPWNWYKVT